MSNSLQEILEFAKTTSQLAGESIMKFYKQNSFEVRQKRDDSLVTDADLESERIIISRIAQAFPDDHILAEEAGLKESHVKGAPVWVIDPLDGTTNFAKGYDFFCVSIARGVYNQGGDIDVELGCIYNPIEKKTYYARRGGGAWLDGQRLSLRAIDAFSKAFLVTGFPSHGDSMLKKDIMSLYEIACKSHSTRRDGAAALDMALVAQGIYDGFWERGLMPWDVAAGSLLVEEAGGIVRNYGNGHSFRVEDSSVICGSSLCVQEIMAVIQQHHQGSSF